MVVGSMLLCLAAIPLASADGLKHKKSRAQHHLNHARSDLDESSAGLRKATAALQASEQKLKVARNELARARGQLTAAESLDEQMQAKLDAAEARLASAQSELSAGRARVAGQERTLGQIVVQNYQSGDPSLMGLSMVLTTQDPTELSGQLNSVQNVLDKEKVTLDRLKASRVLLTVQEQQVAAAKVEVARQRTIAAENLARKKVLEAAAETARTEVAGLVADRRQAHQQARKARAADLAEVHKAERERARISALLRRRAAAARRRAAAHSHPSLHTGGVLIHPVPGPVTSPFGWRIHPIYGYRSLHDGVDLGAGCGTPIRAAADGKVLEEYFQTAWGNRLIMDNGFHRGAGIGTIYNHMSGYVAHTGQHVKQGQVLGYVGTTGWSTGCHLHFTVLRNGVAVNPMSWF
jgi:murein DD-endopeptidase MepM/ murein hydrolase activator NlpD